MRIFFEPSIPLLIFYLITVLWIVEFIIFPTKPKKTLINKEQPFTIVVGLIVFNIAFSVALIRSGMFTLENTSPALMRGTGLGVYAAGVLLRYTAAITRKNHHARHAKSETSMPLIAHGPYHALKHPSHLGLFLLVVGIPLFFANWMALIIAAFSMFGVLNRRMKLEEKVLQSIWGETYRDWEVKRYRFLPFIY